MTAPEADVLTVLSARAVKTAVAEVVRRFMAGAGQEVRCDFAPVGAIERKLADGIPADIVILSDAAVGRLVASAAVSAESVRALGRTSIGVAVRDGAPLPDISTPQAFRDMLIDMPSIAVSDAAVGGTAARYLPQLFARMGIAEAIENKLVRCAGGGDVTERVVRGEAAIGITFISEILAVPGSRVVGPLPAIYGNDTTYCAGVMTSAGAKTERAIALVSALCAPDTRDVWRAAGFSDAGTGGR